jgi:hypothetical protein
LQQVDERRTYLHYGRSSLFHYAVQELHLSESVAYNLISVTRKAREVPELRNKIERGEITLTNARKIAPVLTAENQIEWLAKASVLSQRELEKEVVKIRPELSTPERAKYVTETRLKLELGISENELLKLRRAQNLLSQFNQRAISLEETLIEMTDFYLSHRDPVEKASRILAKKSEGTVALQAEPTAQAKPITQPKTTAFNQKQIKREPIPALLLHQVNLRDQRKCCFAMKSEGNSSFVVKCGQSRWIEIHHRIPVSAGGKNTLENLITLCSTHHRFLHSETQNRGRDQAQVQVVLCKNVA